MHLVSSCIALKKPTEKWWESQDRNFQPKNKGEREKYSETIISWDFHPVFNLNKTEDGNILHAWKFK